MSEPAIPPVSSDSGTLASDRTPAYEHRMSEGGLRLDSDPPTRAGYVTLVGRPNAGKSTLMNRMVGEHLSIVTSKAQTTWQRVTGILTVDGAQAVFLDTPGLLDARDLLQRSMLAAAQEALAEADVVLVVVDAREDPTAREAEVLGGVLRGTEVPAHVALNKTDAATRARLDAWRSWLDPFQVHIHEISAQQGEGIEDLLEALVTDLPESPFLYPEDDIASAPVRFFVAELIRETVFEQYDEEIPYATWVQIGEFRENQEPIYIQADVLVERKSQKGILIGAGGRAIRSLGEESRRKIEHFLGERVYLDLWVKPLKAWRKSRAHLGRMGFRVPDDDDASR